MINILRGSDLWMKTQTASSMFRDRRRVFCERLDWPLAVDENGFEIDSYDHDETLYVISTDGMGRHLGSFRILPTIGKNLGAEVFGGVFLDQEYQNNETWECTRFCISPEANRNTAQDLFAIGARLMKEAGVERLVSTFEKPMIKIYRKCGALPKILDQIGNGRRSILFGCWEFDDRTCANLQRASKVDPIELELAIANIQLETYH